MRQSEHTYRRRRLGALGVLAAAAAACGAVVGAGQGGAPAGAQDDRTQRSGAAEPAPPKQVELPRGGRRIFPDFRVVAFYGAPQSHELGELGIGSPDSAASRLRRQAAPYRKKTRPVLPAFELIATVANAHAGADGMFRTRQSDAVIRRYLRAARRAKALLLLDIQPGHADFIDEVRHLDRWLREPDVGLALDPEWHTPGVQPGTVIGSVEASKVNEVTRHLAAIVREHELPEKLFVVHQFTADMIRDKAAVDRPPGLAVTMNVDGFGDRANKVSKYREFTSDGSPFHHGYKLFYKEDTGLMSPRSVLALQPPPDLVVYE
ncbi:MAG: hypothetical protein QOD55_870 [Solirubrobacteraceae bacterium]|jgi:hypothetical protein|nr:hypothetical protein [Solirubrobacteraceae bacterium]MEA2288873.1 hypothetical protein [Solirubrobacteraceae bacterium]